MRNTGWGRAALVALGAALALGVSGCEDPAAKAKAEADAKAKSEAAAARQKLDDKIARNVECLNAIRWQRAALSGVGIGSLEIYNGYYQANLDEALGDTVQANDPPKPTLSRATLKDYLEWAYGENVKTEFAAGKDANNDGKLTAQEHSGRGFGIVVGCIQEVAERGKGPLAGKDKVGRMYRMQAIQGMLVDKGE
jgi:hypothetical protein